jgi:hypothetical protein
MFFSFIPPSQIKVGSPVFYVGLLIVLAVFFVAVPFVVYQVRRASWRDPESEFAPFTWEVTNTAPGSVTTSAKAPDQLDRVPKSEPEQEPEHVHAGL